MDTITLKINNKKLNRLPAFLKNRDFVEVLQDTPNAEHNKVATKSDAFFALAGIWEDRDITVEELRANAWPTSSMKLKEIIERHHWLRIETTLLQCYPDQHKNIDGYRKVYQTLQQSPSTGTAMQLQIRLVEDEASDEPNYHDVCGTQPGDSITYALEFRPWAEWLGMTITAETRSVYTELEILAHCLFEMTFAGFDEKTIQDEWNEIIATSEALKSMSEAERKEHLISMNDLLRELGEGE